MNTKLLLLLAAAGGAAYVLTRKSEAPPVAPAAALPRAVVTPKPLLALPPLDSGLSAPERAAVQKALSRETVAANLTSFAATFEPMFPVAASVLRAKAASLPKVATAGEHEPCCPECAQGDRPPCTPHVTGGPVTMGLPTIFQVR